MGLILFSHPGEVMVTQVEESQEQIEGVLFPTDFDFWQLAREGSLLLCRQGVLLPHPQMPFLPSARQTPPP